jgi:hypothetical protein
MKMAKASEADLDMAMELCSAIDALTSSWPTLPTSLCKPGEDEPDEAFDCDDDRQCGTVLRHLLAIAERASLLRVVFGFAVMLDPRNKLIDPDADTIEVHPDIQVACKDAERLRWLLEDHDTDTRARCDDLLRRMPAMSYGDGVAAIDAAMAEAKVSV